MNDRNHVFADDILRGAGEIALYMFGDKTLRRRVYHLAATSNFPAFKMGALICVRKSVVLEWIEDQERRR
jgi:hypothetical protein